MTFGSRFRHSVVSFESRSGSLSTWGIFGGNRITILSFFSFVYHESGLGQIDKPLLINVSLGTMMVDELDEQLRILIVPTRVAAKDASSLCRVYARFHMLYSSFRCVSTLPR